MRFSVTCVVINHYLQIDLYVLDIQWVMGMWFVGRNLCGFWLRTNISIGLYWGVDGDFIKKWPIVGCQLSIAEMML